MSRDLKRITITAGVLLVALRMCIGWQFLYEGLWKYQTQDTARPWSAEGYLSNAAGPFRGLFRSMAGDPDGLDWLNYQHTNDRWNAWSERFASHYFLSHDEIARLKQRATEAEAKAGQLYRKVEDLKKAKGAKTAQADDLQKLPFEVYAAALKPLVDDPKTRSTYRPLLDELRAIERRANAKDADAAEVLRDAEAMTVAHITGMLETTEGRIRLDEQQRADLGALLEGRDEFVVKLKRLPEGVVFDGSLGGNIEYRPGELFIPKERSANLGEAQWRRLRGQVTRQAEPEYHAALDRLEQMQSAVGYRQLLADYLKENPEWTGKVTDAKGEVIESHTGKLELYRSRLRQYEQALAEADQDFEREHLKRKWSEIQTLKAELVPTVQGLERDMKSAALALLTPGQRTMAPPTEEGRSIDRINWTTIWALIGLGVLLIVGLLTRVAAFFGACMVLSFYLVAPPWPGVPVEAGPEHNWIVNKNLIEVVALLALAFLPSGSWFGLDGLFRRLFNRPERTRETPPAAAKLAATGGGPKPAATAAR